MCEDDGMRGRPNRQPNLFVKINLEELVPADHPLRPIKRMADEALAAMSRTFAAAYAPAEKGGRPSIPPERLLKALVLMSLYTVRSERALCERIAFDMLFRWFLDMTPDEPCFDNSVFSVNRERLDRLDITKKFSDRIVMMAMDAGLISDDHFSIDGSLLQSHASLKSLKQIERQKAAAEGGDADQKKDDDGDGGTGGNVGNPWVDFKGQKRSNKTHRSVTDPEARLYTKTSGVAYLQHSMHVLMENRHGIGVDIRVGKADGHAERECALKMLERVKSRLGLEPATLGADKGYDAEDFLLALRERSVEPHIACKSKKGIEPPGENQQGAWERWFNQQSADDDAFKISQRKRKLDEEIFGWLKQFGGLRRARVTRRWKIQQLADIALGTLNLIRMSKLLAT
jgi:transposase